MKDWLVTLATAKAAPIPEGARSALLMKHGTMTLRYYAPRGRDPQAPHEQDEIYLVASGSGTFALGKHEGARLLTGGSCYDTGACANGYFFEPTIFDRVRPDMRIAQEEIFGPVLSIIEVSSFEEALQVMNGTAYGLSSSIYTRDVDRAFRAMRDIEAGITYINGPTIGAEVHLPFGGVKDTGNGHREAGTTVYDIFTEWKSICVDYSGKLQ